MAVLGLRFCARAFSCCGRRGPLFIAVRGPLTIAASLVAEHRLQMRRLSSCGTWAQLLRGMWDFPRPGLEPVSPALANRVSTTAPPGKPWILFLVFSICTYVQVSKSERQQGIAIAFVTSPYKRQFPCGSMTINKSFHGTRPLFKSFLTWTHFFMLAFNYGSKSMWHLSYFSIILSLSLPLPSVLWLQ